MRDEAVHFMYYFMYQPPVYPAVSAPLRQGVDHMDVNGRLHPLLSSHRAPFRVDTRAAILASNHMRGKWVIGSQPQSLGVQEQL